MSHDEYLPLLMCSAVLSSDTELHTSTIHSLSVIETGATKTTTCVHLVATGRFSLRGTLLAVLVSLACFDKRARVFLLPFSQSGLN